MAVTFEGYERRIDKINKVLASYGIKDLEEARKICLDKGIDVDAIVNGVQPSRSKTPSGLTPWAAR